VGGTSSNQSNAVFLPEAWHLFSPPLGVGLRHLLSTSTQIPNKFRRIEIVKFESKLRNLILTNQQIF
jgi:hypothetical protein